MKKLIITLLITTQVVCSFAQKYGSIDSVPGVPVFSCTDTTPMEIVKDKKFITTNAKKFIDFSNEVLDQKLLGGSALDYAFFLADLGMANLILGNYNAAADLFDSTVLKAPRSLLFYFATQVYLDVKTGKEKTYADAFKSRVKHFGHKELELYDLEYGHGIEFLSSDTAAFRKNLEQIPSSDNPVNQKLTMTQFGDFLTVYGENIVADAVVNDFVKGSIFDLDKWSKVWDSKLYHFTKKDSLHEVLACNYQVFDRSFFDSGILWHNLGEIPGNHIDDDSNGIVDDVCGYEYNKANPKIKEPVVLDGPGDHGSMAVELMLKGNPRVQFMAIEHNQYNFPAWYPALFTKDIAHNQHVVDSLIHIFINSFQEMAEYCNHFKVRVVEINSIGANEKDFYLKGCGKDSTETKEFAKKMFTKLKDGMTIAYLKTPNTLYVNGAGNDNVDIDSIPDMINFIRLPNIIIAGALYKDLQRTYYSCYGKGVDVFAPAHFPLKLVKFKSKYFAFLHNESGGTSAAAPVVANLAIQILELNPNLTAAQVKQLIINGADKEPYEKGINIIDPKKTIALLKAE